MINDTYFLELKEIKELPKLYPLNLDCWLKLIKNIDKEEKLASKKNNHFIGKYLSNILILKLKIINNDIVYCFFYLDEKNNIKQGYIKINIKNKEKEKEIMNTLKDGPLEFINNLRNNNFNDINQWLTLNYIELFSLKVQK